MPDDLVERVALALWRGLRSNMKMPVTEAVPKGRSDIRDLAQAAIEASGLPQLEAENARLRAALEAVTPTAHLGEPEAQRKFYEAARAALARQDG